MGVMEFIALAGLLLTGVGGTYAGVKALWSISSKLGAYKASVDGALDGHGKRLDDHEDRLRSAKL